MEMDIRISFVLYYDFSDFLNLFFFEVIHNQKMKSRRPRQRIRLLREWRATNSDI